MPSLGAVRAVLQMREKTKKEPEYMEPLRKMRKMILRTEKKKRPLRDWCSECVFKRINIDGTANPKGKYLQSKATSPTPFQCIECYYKLLQFGKIEVTKPKYWNEHEKRKK